MNLIFSDLQCEYKILDYTVSHKQLLIRSLKNKNRDYNVDIIIKGVSLLFVPSSIEGLEIFLYDGLKDSDSLFNGLDFRTNSDVTGFLIQDAKTRKFFINGSSLGIYHNQLDILETSIGRYDYDNLNENIFWYSF